MERFADEQGRTVRYNIEIESQPSLDAIFHPPPQRFAALVHDVIARHGIEARTNVRSFNPRALNAMHASSRR